MELTKENVLKALGTVQEPDLKKDLVTLGMVKDILIEGNDLTFTIVLTTPACPLKGLIQSDCEKAIEKEIGKNVNVKVKFTDQVTSTRLNSGPVLPGVKNIIAIASGKGGVGKSTVTTNLAVALAGTGAKVGLIDADIFGPSIPTMFNVEKSRPNVKDGANGKTVIIPVEMYGVKLLSIGFLSSPEEAVVWRGPMASSALKQFITDADWGELDYMLIDLPPGTSDIHLTLVQTVPVTGAIVVTTPQKVALVDATRAVSMFRQPQINVPVLGIVENMAYFTPEDSPEKKYYLFGKDGGKGLAEKYELPFLGEIPLVQGIRESGDAGTPAVLSNDVSSSAFKNLASALAQQIAIRNAKFAETKKVEITT